MFLDGWHDHHPPIFEGAGRFTLRNSTDIDFVFDAKGHEQAAGLKALRRCAEEPDDRTSAMRLRGVDDRGVEWHAGWVRPRFGKMQGDCLQLFGESGGLSTHVHGMEPKSSVELVYSPTPEVPFTETSAGRHQVELLGSVIEVTTQPSRGELWICASTSEDLGHPYLENWLSEPLRALRGQLIYPRLVARNFRDGHAAVSVRPAPPLRATLGGCASQLRNRSPAEFWSFYRLYLTYIAQHRNADGNPEFEANGLTRLHDEVIQARMAGSHWVIALCVASAVEGLVKLDPGFASTPPDFTEEDLLPARDAISGVKNKALRDRLSNSIASLGRASIAKYLSRMQRDGTISKNQLEAWKKVRHAVAHGNLFEPWGTPQERERLIDLIQLFYRLTAIRIGYV